MRVPVIIVGAGGHAKVVISTARACGHAVAAIVDDDPAKWGQSLLGIRVAGPTATALEDRNATCVLAVGANAARARLAGRACCSFVSLVHPGAVVDDSVELGEGTVVFAGCVIQADTRIGRHGIVNTGASIDHDCVLGTAVHVAPGARLAGGVTLGDEVMFGIGACVIPGVAIGDRATIAAGAAVVRDIPADVMAAGVPARPWRPRRS
jgi:UDP-perosamine 4-acetyltransferase